MSTINNPVSIGSKGPGGGIIFHIDNTGLHGLEARPATEARAMAWPNATDFVASLVRNIGPGWRLPTIEELQLLYQKKAAVGGFDHDFHWSSTEVDSNNALSLVDKTGGIYPLRKRGDACYVRAIRAFGPNDTIHMESKVSAIKVEPHERIAWSKAWQYNYDKNFSQGEKDEIFESIKAQGLTPDSKIAQGYNMENSKFIVFVYLVKGVWEINGANRK